MSVLVIRNARTAIAGFDQPRLIEGADIVVKDDRIVSVGVGVGEDAVAGADKVIDAAGCLVYPGMVCAHHHYYSGLSRGIMARIGPTPDFISTLKELWWRIDRALDEESVYFSSLICSMDAIRAGTTAVIDHHSSPSYIHGSLDAIRRGFAEVGLRGMTCYEVTNRNGGEAEIDAGVEENIRFAQQVDRDRRNGSGTCLVEAAVGGHAPFTISDRGMERLREALEETGRGIHIHLAEDFYDVSVSHHLYGKDLVVRMADFGLIDPRSILVHGIYLSTEDIRILNSRGAFLVHNARSNMNNHVGWNSRLEDIENPALGTDGIGADMFEELKIAFFKNRDAGGAFWPADYLKALTNGNRILDRYFVSEKSPISDGTSGRPHVGQNSAAFPRQFGRLEAGFKADIVISDYQSPTPLAAENLAGHLAFGMGSGSVKTVIVDGRTVLEDREFPFDADRLYREAALQAGKVWSRMDSI